MVCMRGRLIGPDSGSPPWHRIATGPWCLLKVRLCSPLQLGNTSCRCVFRLLPTPSSSTSQSLHARISPVSLSVHISISPCSDYDYVQNSSIQEIYAWRKLLGVLRGGVGWGLGTLFARQGDKCLLVNNLLEHLWTYLKPRPDAIRLIFCDRQTNTNTSSQLMHHPFHHHHLHYFINITKFENIVMINIANSASSSQSHVTPVKVGATVASTVMIIITTSLIIVFFLILNS